MKKARSGLVTFRPRARLMRLLGAELISDEVVAMTELVKNAHDADASTVSITFEGTSGGQGVITVSDNGDGMDLDALLERWMQPASSWKRESKTRRTRGGRRVLGEKGVGRFATDKLAARLELISRPRRSREELRATFDWDQFDGDTRMLSDVKSRWELRKPEEIKKHGTILRLTGLRSSWNERMFRRLSTRLTRLISPFDAAAGFSIAMDSDEFPEYSGELRPEFVKRAPYRIEAAFDGGDSVDVRLNGGRSVSHLWNGAGDLRCGPVRIRLFAFDLETEAIARIGPRMEVRAWLRQWTGVSVYRDAFRIWPYGEPHDDWLRLDQRRVNNPVVRLSNNQIVGFIAVSQDQNPDLRDQTNREGLIHNRALDDLRRLMYFVLQILEAERQALRHPVERVKGKANGSDRHSSDGILKQLDKLSRRAEPGLKKELKRLSGKIAGEFESIEARQKALTERYADLAALGQAAVGLHDSTHELMTAMSRDIERLNECLDGRSFRPLGSLSRSLSTLEQRIQMIAPIERASSGHRRRTIDIAAELHACREWLEPMLESCEVRLELDLPRRGLLRSEMIPSTFARLVHLLANNSIEWLKSIEQPRIRVSARPQNGHCQLIFSDNGPGVPAALADQVFNPSFSGKENGRGMGLFLARSLVESGGGRISLLTDRRRKGANLEVLLPRKRSRATVKR